MLSVHCADSYATAWGNARLAFYDNIFTGYPTFVYDGLFDAWPIGTYVSNFIARQAVPTDVTIDLVAHQQTGETFDVVATVCVESGGVGKNMRIHVVQSLDQYPVTEDYNRNTVMQGLAGIDVWVDAGSCEVVSQPITFDAVSWSLKESIQLTAWAQEPFPSDPAEVFQARQIEWPFVDPPIFADGFEDGTTGAWSSVTP